MHHGHIVDIKKAQLRAFKKLNYLYLSLVSIDNN